MFGKREVAQLSAVAVCRSKPPVGPESTFATARSNPRYRIPRRPQPLRWRWMSSRRPNPASDLREDLCGPRDGGMTMSAQALHPVTINVARPIKKGDTDVLEKAKDYASVISRLPFEALYQLCFAPEPTREQIARERFLLDCD